MPSSTMKRELHLAKSLSQLQKKAEIAEFKPNNFERISKLADQLFINAKTHLDQGDEEQAYFYFYRFMALMKHVQECDKNKFMTKLGGRTEQAFKCLETLADRLTKRYDEKQKQYEDRKEQLFNQPITSVPGTSVKVTTQPKSTEESKMDIVDNDSDDYPCIDSVKLMQYIQSLAKVNKILIIDIRSSANFEESSIAANKLFTTGEVNIINIPEEDITPGFTCAKLLKMKFGLALDALERRRSMDRVVIIDEHTHHFEKSSKSILLADALWKWDPSPNIIKSKPYLLEGGFGNFLLTYPTSTTNGNYVRKEQTPVFKPKSLGNNIFEYEFEEEKKVPTKLSAISAAGPAANSVVNNGTASSSSLPDHSAMYNYFSKTNSNNNINNNNTANSGSGKFPGVAKPVIPDRSSKPQITKLNNDISMKDINETNDNNSKALQPKTNNLVANGGEKLADISNKHLNSNSINSSSSMLVSDSFKNSHTKYSNFANENQAPRGSSASTYNNGDIKMHVDDDLVAGEFDDDFSNSGAKMPPSTPVHKRTEVFHLDEDMSEDEEDEENNHENSHTNSRPMMINNGGKNYSSSLSRSLSSPNIAQFEQESQDASYHSVGNGTPKFSNQIPIVDRSVKPLPYQAALRKARDFSPQFSSCARITGLRNLGNTCFMNAVLQCLNNTNELNESLRSGTVYINSNSKFGSNGELTIELMELFKQMVYPSNYKHISPRDFKIAVSRHIPDFVDYKQQDAHEFLVRFLDRVHADLNECKSNPNLIDPAAKDPNYYDKLSITTAANSFWTLHMKRNKSIITDLFEGLIVSSLTCLHCSYTSKALEAFTCLSLPIQEGGRTSLKNSLNMFLRRERITDEAAWQCPTCKQKRDAEKCTYIWRLPKILVIHLKRFSYDGMWRQKISTFVDFPLENLTIEARDGEESRCYSLYGVVNHTGSLDGGHYIAFSRNKDLGISWHRYDDQDVSPVSPSDVITGNAYVLFYKYVP